MMGMLDPMNLSEFQVMSGKYFADQHVSDLAIKSLALYFPSERSLFLELAEDALCPTVHYVIKAFQQSRRG